jgi:hypothetical protein
VFGDFNLKSGRKTAAHSSGGDLRFLLQFLTKVLEFQVHESGILGDLEHALDRVEAEHAISGVFHGIDRQSRTREVYRAGVTLKVFASEPNSVSSATNESDEQKNFSDTKKRTPPSNGRHRAPPFIGN